VNIVRDLAGGGGGEQLVLPRHEGGEARFSEFLTWTSAMWSPVVQSEEEKVPSCRSKHAAVLHDQHLYMLGGRNGNVALRDFWRYSIAKNSWEPIRGGGDAPGCLQDHTMVAFRDTLYVFGGELSFCNDQETPLWFYHLQTGVWEKFATPKGGSPVTPRGRRGHTAVVFQDSMYIYGGYQDLKGSTAELWAFHFPSATWHLVSQGGAVDCPPRHRHSAVLHDSAMWVFGGMNDLQERSDFWKFDFVSRSWRPVKSKPGPGCLHSHTAVKFLNVMILFGGEQEGQTLNDLWRFHFATEFWEKLVPASLKPQPRSQMVGFVFTQFQGEGGIRYMGKPQQDFFGPPSTPSLSRPLRAVAGVASRLREEAGQLARNQGTRYSFLAPDSCAEEEEEEGEGSEQKTKLDEGALAQLPRELFRDLRRPSQFQRLESQTSNSNNSSGSNGRHNSILKDFAKASQLGLWSGPGGAKASQLWSGNSQLWSGLRPYSVFNNESCESLNSSTASPASIRLAASQSTHQLASSPNREEEPTSPNGLPSQVVSHTNFQDLQQDDDEEEEVVFSLQQRRGGEEDEGEVWPNGNLVEESWGGVGRSDSQFTFQSYDCSSRNSTLSSRPANGEAARLVEVEEEGGRETSDDFSTISGYDSLEAGLNFNSECANISSTDCLLSFSNPNYSGPELARVGQKPEREVVNRRRLGGLRDEEDQHTTFAAALMSPPVDDLPHPGAALELREAGSLSREREVGKTRPKSAFLGAATTELQEVASEVRRQRPLSTGEEDLPACNGFYPPQLRLLMYVIGGREVGQVTVFRRPLSIWRLELTRL